MDGSFFAVKEGTDLAEADRMISTQVRFWHQSAGDFAELVVQTLEEYSRQIIGVEQVLDEGVQERYRFLVRQPVSTEEMGIHTFTVGGSDGETTLQEQARDVLTTDERLVAVINPSRYQVGKPTEAAVICLRPKQAIGRVGTRAVRGEHA